MWLVDTAWCWDRVPEGGVKEYAAVDTRPHLDLLAMVQSEYEVRPLMYCSCRPPRRQVHIVPHDDQCH